MRVALALCVVCAHGCADERQVPAPKLVAAEGACNETLECEPGLHCSESSCTEPQGPQETRAVRVAGLQREIAETHRLEEAAYTEQGKRKMRAERAKLEGKLAAAERGG